MYMHILFTCRDVSSIFLIIQNMVSRLEKDVASRDHQLRQARAFKERVDKEREAATLEREQAKVWYM